MTPPWPSVILFLAYIQRGFFSNSMTYSSSKLSHSDSSCADPTLPGIGSSHDLLQRYEAGERDFRGALLRYADLIRAELNDIDLRQADLSYADLVGARLSKARLAGATLRGADLNGADLRGADLSYADLSGVYLNGAYLCEADLRGARLEAADLRGAFLDRWTQLDPGVTCKTLKARRV